MTKYLFALLSGMAVAIPDFATKPQFAATYSTEWQWDFHKSTNWVNLLRLDASAGIKRGGSFELSTLHVAKTNEHIIADYQVFSNIEEENAFALIAKLGYGQGWEHFGFFAGVRNVNEDYFISPQTAFFLNSSCGIFPTISANYPIANYPLSGLCAHLDFRFGKWQLQNSLYNGTGYNGWRKRDNPFLVRPSKDGLFDMIEINYQDTRCKCFAGAAIHNRMQNDPLGENTQTEYVKKVSCALYAYGEFTLWRNDENQIGIMGQYSQNTCGQSACTLYGQAGCLYENRHMGAVGFSWQYAKYAQGREMSAELSWRRKITPHLILQPSLQYINNKEGNFAVLLMRLSYSFEMTGSAF